MTQRIISTTVVATLALAMSTWSVSMSGAATSKPAGDRIGADLRTLTWGFPLVNPGTHRGKAIVVTNPQIVAKVRALINSLPVTVPNPHQMCPMDLVLSPNLAFSVSQRSPTVTRVIVQLGGCAYAQVYQLGRPVSPTLGGPRLGEVFHQIEQLINPRRIALYYPRGSGVL